MTKGEQKSERHRKTQAEEEKKENCLKRKEKLVRIQETKEEKKEHGQPY